MNNRVQLFEESLALLTSLIRTPSFSREEGETATIIAQFFTAKGIVPYRKANNIWVYNKWYSTDKPTILLNSHHDTVKPNTGYTRDPFSPDIVDGKLYGLGSNDAGGCLVSLIATFLHFYEDKDLKYNFCLAATAEEEISGKCGIESIVSDLGALDFAIVGEPTLMNLAIAEKGLMVLDCTAHGISGHAARDEGENALYKALADIEWFRSYQFERESNKLGPIKMSVTMIQCGVQHNVVPATCDYVVDVRTTDAYSNEETLEIIKLHVQSDVHARSTRLNSSSIPEDHPLVLSGVSVGKKTYGSPTMSDQALLRIPSVKLGPGFSGRSHMADEYIFLDEIRKGIDDYINILEKIV